MEKLYPKYGERLTWLSDEGDEYSANPGDYFFVDDPDQDLGGGALRVKVSRLDMECYTEPEL